MASSAVARWGVGISLLALAVAVVLAQQTRPLARTPGTFPSPAVKPNAYVDPALCATCHGEIAATYAKTGMGRSFRKITAENPIEPFSKPFYHEASDSYFAMVQHDGKMFQRRWQSGYDGKETNIEEKQVDYVLGSGNHGRTYLHLTARNGLQQLPMGWYSENGGTWAMLPGFDRPDYPGSERPVHYECIFCHNGYPKIPKSSEEEGAESVYQLPLPNGIDCQRCHGPGQQHIEAVGAGATAQQVRAAIVNPGRLTPQREMEVCMQCHLETSSLKLPHSLQRQNRLPFSYIPGQPLENFELTFDREPGKNTRFEVANAAYAFRKSQCFLQTQSNEPARQLRCTTCHNPHNIPRGAEATAHYNSICNSCHAASLKTASAGTHPANPDCVSCHMPKRRTDDAIHIVMTEHFIQKRPVADTAMKAEYYESDDAAYKGKVVPYYPAHPAPTQDNQLDIAAAQIREGSNLKEGIPNFVSLLQKYQPTHASYYVYLADAYNTSGDPVHAEQYFNEALRRSPNSTVILLKLSNAQIEWQQWAKAEATLRRVIVQTPNDPVALALLGQALYQQGKNDEAKTDLTKAIALDPDLPEPHNYLAAMLVQQRDLAGAEKEFAAALQILPNNADWQSNLGGLLAAEGRIPEARYLFERAIKLHPENAGARINYARLLANLNQMDEAVKQAEAAAAADPKNPIAHELWGILLTSLGDPEGAARELNIAVTLRPDFWRAHYEFGVALGMKNDVAGATAELRKAAQGDDPQAKAAAQQLLSTGPGR
jgi:predicted CXXCH cytochrome family protein